MKKSLALCLLSLMLLLTACGGNNGGNTPKNAPTNTPATTNNAPAEEPATNAGVEAPALTPEEGAELVVWDSKNQRAVLEELVAEFTAQYNVPVKIEEVESPDQVGKLTIDGPNKNGADVVTFPHDSLGAAVSAGLILPNDVFADDTKNNNAESAVNAVTYAGELYGYPRSVETYGLFYNKDLVTEAPKTFDDIVKFAEGFNDTAAGKYALMWEVQNFYFNYPFIATNGGYIFGSNGEDAADIGLNNEGAVKSLETFKSLKSILPIAAGDITADIIESKFASGDIAMTITGPWKVGDFRKLGINFGVVPIPTLNGEAAISLSGVKAWYVNSYSEYPIAARLLANFLGSKESQLKDFAATGAIPANKEAMEDPTFVADEISSGIAAQFINSNAMPSIPEMGKVWDPSAAALADIWNTDITPKDAIDNAVKQITDAINGATN
ncbi:MAG: maltose ABC transporter substrate-binding protein [Candidatus Pristimantibacillus lignocellulolyticus]|uniref:Maltodextrin-binding protein n=1 Tax=Candidatus Pristimantibacillus lignocellulolyticus TaxID=2994561 RepID=A0A9J6ZGQ5_9BACL|nr:MAG: maltose ABC transporter substrate-binding protein [Candidatus Pristimantibacillus lignocellulolyticus]